MFSLSVKKEPFMEIMAHTPVSVMMAKPIETLELLYSMIWLLSMFNNENGGYLALF